MKINCFLYLPPNRYIICAKVFFAGRALLLRCVGARCTAVVLYTPTSCLCLYLLCYCCCVGVVVSREKAPITDCGHKHTHTARAHTVCFFSSWGEGCEIGRAHVPEPAIRKKLLLLLLLLFLLKIQRFSITFSFSEEGVALSSRGRERHNESTSSRAESVGPPGESSEEKAINYEEYGAGVFGGRR